MRSALICVFFALLVPKDGISAENEEDFKPTPIPLSDWPRDKQEPAGTLQDIIKTDAPPAVAAVPAHYWEDALRHSVYLTLVRDKIDQLIAKGDVISPDSRPDNNEAKEIDDHDLWEKIKTARFDRLQEKPIPPTNVAILARGRLIEDSEGYRFAEDDPSHNNCSDSYCTKGVKAYWSVKRMRQGEASPGKYHYELTFSVSSQTNRKVKKPYENPVRTFTIKENSPTERPKVRGLEKFYNHPVRPQRAIWVHKNISPPQSLLRRPTYTRSLDRIFSSLFSDEESYEDPSTSYRPKPKQYIQPIYQHAKIGYVEERDPYQHKKVIPYPMLKSQSLSYSHPPIRPPPISYVQHPYLNVDNSGNFQYTSQHSDNRYGPSNVVKTTRPAVLPTPITNNPFLKESTIEVPVKTKLNATENTTKQPDVVTTYKIFNHPKLSPMRISYFPDQIRPPVYNAPPGVFVTMDKKPFKPMPPLKYAHSHKPLKTVPLDFRPSPQVLDTQFSEEDSSADTAFRPITLNYTDDSNTKESNDNGKKTNRKTGAGKKPTKKQENIKSHRFSTVPPEIITAQTETFEKDDTMEWANILGSFTKTTPMASQRGSTEKNEPITTTTAVPTTETISDYVEVSSEEFSPSTTTTTTTTMTPKPKKRTRPPPKFNKPDKIKKHKRVTSTTTTTTTIKPTRTYPFKKPSDDLTPQASSATTSGFNSVWETKHNKAPITTTTSSTTPRPTTTIRQTTSGISTTTSTSSTTVDTEQPVATTQPKSKNRFRQSTLMHKGTSVNHDKWSSSTYEKNRTNTNKFPLRRKASKFQGYIPSSTPRSPEIEKNREDHMDHSYNYFNQEIIDSTTEQNEDIMVKVTQSTQPTYEEQKIKNESETNIESEVNNESKSNIEVETKNEPERNIEQPPEWPHDDEIEEDAENYENEAHDGNDGNEYIFPTASNNHEVKSNLDEPSSTTEIMVVASPYSEAKNKTKCKKKKHNNLMTTEDALSTWSGFTETSADPTNTGTTSTTPRTVTQDYFDELFGGFTMDDATEKPKSESSTPPPEPNFSQSQKQERFDDDIEDFLDSLRQKSNHHVKADKSNEEYDDDEEVHQYSPFNNNEKDFDSKDLNDDYYEETDDESPDRPFSLLELMAME